MRNKHRTSIIFSVGILVCGFLVISLGFGQRVLEGVASPVSVLGANAHGLKLSLEYGSKTRSQLIHTIEELKRENAELGYEEFTRKVAKTQSEELKEELGWSEAGDTFNLSRVLVRPPVSAFDSLTTAVMTPGPEIGARVRVSESVEVGRVASVRGTSAIVDLYTSTKTRTPVEINGSGPLVIAEGAGAGTYTLHIPKSFEVESGDVLVRPGTKDVIIGVVESVNKDETDSFSLVRARLPVNIFEITWVYVEGESRE